MSDYSTIRGFLVFVLGVVIGVAAIAIGPLPFGATPIDFLACITIAWIASLVRLVIIKRAERQEGNLELQELGRESGGPHSTARGSTLNGTSPSLRHKVGPIGRRGSI